MCGQWILVVSRRPIGDGYARACVVAFVVVVAIDAFRWESCDFWQHRRANDLTSGPGRVENKVGVFLTASVFVVVVVAVIMVLMVLLTLAVALR